VSTAPEVHPHPPAPQMRGTAHRRHAHPHSAVLPHPDRRPAALPVKETTVTALSTRPHPAPAVPLLYKIADAARMLRMSRSVIYEQIQARRLRIVKQGRATFITAAALADYIALLETEAEATQ
jgi:hypothetical protein